MYQEFGLEDTLSRLDGMYAICILDTRKKVMYLVRDKIGEKPLYYFKTSEVFLFASEYKAFYCHPSFTAELDKEALNEYLLFRYVSGGDTLIKGVKNLTPGTYLKIDDNGEISQHKYWELPNVKPNTLTKEDNKKELERLIKLSLKRRLIADRNIGIQLSGGADSSYLAYITSQMLSSRLHTFSMKFEDERYSEEKYIDIVNDRINAIPHKYVFDSKLMFDLWKDLTWYFENPMNHEGSLGLVYLNRKASSEVTVLLCGEGADETLGGYPSFSFLAQFKHKPISFWNIFRLLRNYQLSHKTIHFNARDYYIAASQYISDRMFKMIGGKKSSDIDRVFNKRRTIFDNVAGKGLRKFLNYDTVTYMQDILMRGDKCSMAASIECRIPFLMPELLEFNCSIPDEFLVKPASRTTNRTTKILLKELVSDIYGESFTYRNKYGFGAPVLDFMNDKNIVTYIEECLLPGIKKRKVLDYEGVKKLWDFRHTKRFTKTEIEQALWVSFSFEIWAQMYLDDSPVNYRK